MLSNCFMFTWYVSSMLSNAFCQLLSSLWSRCSNSNCTVDACSRFAATAGHGCATQTHGVGLFSGCKWPSRHKKLNSFGFASAGKPVNWNDTICGHNNDVCWLHLQIVRYYCSSRINLHRNVCEDHLNEPMRLVRRHLSSNKVGPFFPNIYHAPNNCLDYSKHHTMMDNAFLHGKN